MGATATGTMPAAAPTVAARNLAKRYGGVRALTGVSLDIWPGSVHALLGENGAGKSTFVKILAGAERPDEGEVRVRGRPLAFNSPAEARQSGIAVVHQELSLFPDLRVISNVYAGQEEHGRLGWLRHRRMRAAFAATMSEIGWSVSLDREVGRLGLAEQQMVEIMRAFHFRADLVLLDEPNSSFSDTESRALYDAVRRFRSRGQAFLLVSHRLDEALAIADDVTILRDGRVVHAGRAADLSVREAVELMVGAAGQAPPRARSTVPADAPLRLATSRAAAGRLSDLSLELRRGEIVGVAGLDGSGVQELFDALFGVRRLDRGTMALDGKPYRPRSPADAIRAGVASIPADRRVDGLMMNRAVGENIVLVILGRLATALGLVRGSAIHAAARRFIGRFRIRAANADVAVATLSGGNQQKVVLAKWLAADPSVLLLNDPTRGIDVGAKAEVHEVIRELAAAGVAILVWSSESEELLGLCHRIVVLGKGVRSAELDPVRATRHDLVLAIVGEEAA
jgi:rhamnose transport system ATP-binding protein